MQKLVQGNQAFRRDVFRTNAALFERLARGQKPETLFITCADSRVDPNLITQSRPGDLFTLRNAGNIVPPHGPPSSEAATVEFAVLGLGVRDVIVCGHSDCGAMRALLDPRAAADVPALRAWLAHARPAIDAPDVEAAARANVVAQLANLRAHPSVAAAEARGELRLHGWFYRIGTGEVLAYDARRRSFEPLPELHEAA
ncbi:MAG: carbonic anhydrase [Labilithrix sp.]|nr:carbonic anhydrase [Labilithrix sp.]MCW5815347.1 carbonic anhydrase [Labilithrix sp.]